VLNESGGARVQKSCGNTAGTSRCSDGSRAGYTRCVRRPSTKEREQIGMIHAAGNVVLTGARKFNDPVERCSSDEGKNPAELLTSAIRPHSSPDDQSPDRLERFLVGLKRWDGRLRPIEELKRTLPDSVRIRESRGNRRPKLCSRGRVETRDS
jgi:hypothetical protein